MSAPSAVVIGGGLSGLACAGRLAARGWTVTVVDKGRGVGGRLATRRIGSARFDTGAQFFTVRDAAFAAAVAEWERAGVVVRWCDGFPALGGNAAPDGHPRWRVAGGMNALAKHLARGLAVRDRLIVTAVVGEGAGWRVVARPAEGGDAVDELRADAVVLTAPVPQAIALLEASRLPVDPRLRAVRYDPCCCLLVDLPGAVDAVLPAPGGLRVEGDPAIGWICSQRAKGLRARGDGLIVHARGPWSGERIDRDDAAVLAELLPAARAVWTRAGVTADIGEIQLKRWRYSLPTATIAEASLRVDAPARLALAGDAFGDRPRVEGAWLSGVAAAELIAG